MVRFWRLMVNVAIELVILAGAAFCVLPFFWMLSTSLKTPAEITLVPPPVLPEHPQWSNYPNAFVRAADIGVPFVRCFFNLAVVGIAVTAGVLVTAVLAGFAFSVLQFRGKNVLFLLFLATMMIPFEVSLIPNFFIIDYLGWYDTYAALVVPWTASAFSVFFVRRMFDGLPREMYEAARLDGCSDLRYLWSIGAPMIQPALITIAVFAFLGSWNALVWPLVVTSSPDLSVIQKGLASFIEEATTHYHLLMAAATLTILPIVILYLLAQRWFERGAEQMTT